MFLKVIVIYATMPVDNIDATHFMVCKVDIYDWSTYVTYPKSVALPTCG